MFPCNLVRFQFYFFSHKLVVQTAFVQQVSPSDF